MHGGGSWVIWNPGCGQIPVAQDELTFVWWRLNNSIWGPIQSAGFKGSLFLSVDLNSDSFSLPKLSDRIRKHILSGIFHSLGKIHLKLVTNGFMDQIQLDYTVKKYFLLQYFYLVLQYKYRNIPKSRYNYLKG